MTKILAVLLSLLISGCVGSYANNLADSTAKSAGSTDTICSESSLAAAKETQSGTENSSKREDPTSKVQNNSVQLVSGGNSSSSGAEIQNRDNLQHSGQNCVNSETSTSSNCGSSGYSCSSSRISKGLLQCLQNKETSNQTNGTYSSGTASNVSSDTQTSSVPTSENSSANSVFSGYQNKVISLVNAERTSRGLKALAGNKMLTKTATLKSEDMVKLNYFSHNSPTYGSPFDMLSQFGITYRAAGENIAMGQKTPAQVMQSWMNSQGHRENILNSSYTQIGVGIAEKSNGTLIWTQQFIG